MTDCIFTYPSNGFAKPTLISAVVALLKSFEIACSAICYLLLFAVNLFTVTVPI